MGVTKKPVTKRLKKKTCHWTHKDKNRLHDLPPLFFAPCRFSGARQVAARCSCWRYRCSRTIVPCSPGSARHRPRPRAWGGGGDVERGRTPRGWNHSQTWWRARRRCWHPDVHRTIEEKPAVTVNPLRPLDLPKLMVRGERVSWPQEEGRCTSNTEILAVN